jgi:phosphate:Na+ symporter
VNYGITDILTLLGALGLFLYGMKVMSDALVGLAGDRMRSIMAAATSNRFLALFTGFSITAIIQSSSATSLMVVSFVNAGLLTLSEAVGVIMGANVGTTVTAWLISILGFKVKMSAIALPLVGLGFALTLTKSRKKQLTGLFIVGFALLFIGLEFLKDSVPDIRSNPEILSFLVTYTSQGYWSVLLFLAIGTILTLVVQSSSAAMALTLLMTYEGWLPFDMAAAMVLGQNIGTTITANLAALVANFQAKRAARAHLLFNVLGTIWVLLLFYPFLDFTDQLVQNIEGASPRDSALVIPVALSLFHTVFNLLNAVVLIGALQWIVRLVERWVPEVIEPELAIAEAKYLSEDALNFPQTGIKALTDESLRLLQNTVYKVLAHGMSVHRSELESTKHLKELVEHSTLIPVDIDRIYATQIKSVYSQILEYATRLQSRSQMGESDIETVRNILIADRKLVQVVKKIKPLRQNIERYLESDNSAIRREYNVLRHRILKVTRMIHRLGESDLSAKHFAKLDRQRRNLKQYDVLRNGRVDKLMLNEEISREMATSLMNDSMEAIRLTQLLIDVANILYLPKDEQVERIEEAAPLTEPLNLETLMNAEQEPNSSPPA